MDTLIVFVRLPVEGKVKTRLAATIGNAAACHLYHDMAVQTLETAMQAASHDNSLISKIAVYHSSDDPTEEVAAWLTSALGEKALCIDVKPQMQGSCLGSKMHQAMTEEARTAGRVIIIGSDCPSLTPSILLEAIHALDGGMDVVLGPADDGGYYLLGLTSVALERSGRALYEGIEWSTSKVLSQTLSKAELCKMRVAALLPMLRDIDTIEDLKAVWPNRADSAALKSG